MNMNNYASTTIDRNAKTKFKIEHDFSSNQTFKMFYKSMDSNLNNKVEKVLFIYFFRCLKEIYF